MVFELKTVEASESPEVDSRLRIRNDKDEEETRWYPPHLTGGS
jgi:hypothetical protein